MVDESLDEVRREVWREAYDETLHLTKEYHGKKGRPNADDAEAAVVKTAKAKANEIKNSAYALGKAPEHLTENQLTKVEIIVKTTVRSS